MGDKRLETGNGRQGKYTGNGRQETGDGRWETGNWRQDTGYTVYRIHEMGDRRQKTGDRRLGPGNRRHGKYTGDGREKTGGKRRETGELITVRGRISQFLKDAFDNGKYKLAVTVTIKSAKWGKKYLSVF